MTYLLTSPVEVSKGGSSVGIRPEINFIEGTNVTLTIADNAGTNAVDTTIAASGAGGGPPGTWTQLAKGPTTIADNTEIVVHNATLSAGESPLFLAAMKTAASTNAFVQIIKPGVAGDKWVYIMKSKTDGSIDFIIKHKQGVSKDFDWVVYKVLPT